jgi:hypothetical protein
MMWLNEIQVKCRAIPKTHRLMTKMSLKASRNRQKSKERKVVMLRIN